MKIKKVAALLSAAVIASGCFAAVPSVVPEISSITASAVSSSAKQSITINSKNGGNAADIQNALSQLKGTGGTVKLVGTFNITSSLRMYPDETIDASGAVINGKTDLILNMYRIDNAAVKGGKWVLGKTSQLAKASTCSSCKFENLTVTGGGNSNGCLFVYNSPKTTVINCSFQNTNSQGVYANLSDNFTIVGCKFNKTNGYGIHTYYSDNLKILGNSTVDAKGDGIYCSNVNGGYVSGNVIKNTKANPNLDIDSVKHISRSGCGIFLSLSNKLNVGKQCKYSGKAYTGNTVNKCDNYGIHLNICSDVFIYKLNCTSSGGDCVHNSASAYTTVQSCTLTSTKECAISLVPGSLSSTSSVYKTCKNSVIFNNTIRTTANYGIWVYNTNGTTVAGNKLSNTKGNAISCNGSKNTKISGNKINGTSSANASGIAVSKNSSNVNIGGTVTMYEKKYARNTIKDVKKIGISIDSSTGIITGNTISGSANHGIRTSNSKGIKVQKNTISGAKQHAINITSSPNAYISQNTVTSPVQDGIYVASSNKATVYKNTINTPKKYGIQITKGSKNAIVKSNTIKNPVKQGIVIENSSGCNIKTMSSTTLSSIKTSTTRANGKITAGNTAKIKIGSKYYKCTVKGSKYTSSAFPKQKKNTTVWLYDYIGWGNVMWLSTKVK